METENIFEKKNLSIVNGSGEEFEKKDNEEGIYILSNTAPSARSVSIVEEQKAIKRVRGTKGWCFTYNSDNEQDELWMWNTLKPICERFGFQKEKGIETGNVHLQGWMILKEPRSLKWLQFNLRWFKGCHFERTKIQEAAERYCKKKESRIGKYFDEEISPCNNNNFEEK